MYECAGKIGMSNGTENLGPPPQPKGPTWFIRNRLTFFFVFINVAILISHSAVIWGSNPGVDVKKLNIKYPGFLDTIVHHRRESLEEKDKKDDKKCTSDIQCHISLQDLVGKRTIHVPITTTTGGVTTTTDKQYVDQTLWNYYLNTVIRQDYEVVKSDGTCLTEACGDDNTKNNDCKWCDFHFGNSTTSYSIKECDDNIKEQFDIFMANLALHLFVVAICLVMLFIMPKDDKLKNYITCIIWLLASVYLVGNYGYIGKMLMKEYHGDNICGEILKGQFVGAGGWIYSALSALYLLGLLGILGLSNWVKGSYTEKVANAQVSYALMTRA